MRLFCLETSLRLSQERNNKCTKFALQRRVVRRNEAYVAELMDKWENEGSLRLKCWVAVNCQGREMYERLQACKGSRCMLGQ
ncbi:hypothetical protein MKW98_004196, partial [Papaver atlanticum]